MERGNCLQQKVNLLIDVILGVLPHPLRKSHPKMQQLIYHLFRSYVIGKWAILKKIKNVVNRSLSAEQYKLVPAYS